MGNDWKQYCIKDVTLGIFDGPHATPKKTLTGSIFLGISSLNQGRLDFSKKEHLSDQDYKKWTKRVTPQKDDIVFSYETRLGEVAIIPEGIKCCLGRRLALARPDKTILDPRYFLYYYLSPQFQDFLKSHTISGSTVDRILLTEFPEFPIRLPSLATQKAIAEILGALDDKIELNHQMNQTLEQMAQALFKSWFVDFNPVVTKATGKKPYDMSDEVAALFPDKFEDSDLGPIPERWKLQTIEDLAQYVNGKNFTKNATGSGRIVIRIAELNSGISSSTKYNEVKADPCNIAKPGDLLFSWSGSLDVFRWFKQEGLINQHIFKVIPENYPQWFVHFALIDSMPFFQSIAAGKATTMGHIKREHLRQWKLPVPEANVLKAADSIISPQYSLNLKNEEETLNLTELRDTLLPKLISGEIRIKNAEKIVSETV